MNCFKLFNLIAIFSSIACGKVNKDCNQNTYPNAATQYWYASHQGSQEESHGHFILSCQDGGFVQIGETGFLPNSAKLLIVKTDENGTLLWKKEFHQNGHNLGNSVLEVEDGYILCGEIDQNSALIKLDKTNGNVIFSSNIDNGGLDAFEHVAKTDNGFLAIGYNQAYDVTNTFYTEGYGYATFLDSNGQKMSGVDLSSYISHAYRINAHNNHYYIAGLSLNAESYVLLKMDSTGQVIWKKEYGGSNSDHCFGMDLSNDGFIFLTGHTLSGTENWDTYTIKINLLGDVIWEIKKGNPRGFNPKFIHDEAWDVKATNDGGCIVVAGTGDEYGNYNRKCGNDGDNSNTWHVYLIRYNSTGEVVWEKTFGGGEGIDWAGEAIDLTNDGGSIIAVDDGSFGFLKTSNI
tara:strand:- start:1919 stop:3130 length:1212 start_codon:yes stop_codon:yes gene_type:complete